MHVLRFALHSLCLGAASVISVTSLASAAAALRHSTNVDPYVWISNPLNNTAIASAAWHLILAAAVLWGAAMSCFRTLHCRWLTTACCVLLVILAVFALRDTGVFYALVARGAIKAGFPIPLSLVIAGLAGLLAMFVQRRDWLLPFGSKQPLTTVSTELLGLQSGLRYYALAMMAHACRLAGTAIGALGLVFLHIISFGMTDYVRRADVAIVLGAKVYPDGRPSTSLADRLRSGVALFKTGRVRFLLMTGGTGQEGYNEAQAMREYAIEQGIPHDRILTDPSGANTLASAKNCSRIMQQHGLTSAVLVSHYFHLARCKLLFVEHGIACTTVPAHMDRRLAWEPYFLVRECGAYLKYAVERPFRSAGVPATSGSAVAISTRF